MDTTHERTQLRCYLKQIFWETFLNCPIIQSWKKISNLKSLSIIWKIKGNFEHFEELFVFNFRAVFELFIFIFSCLKFQNWIFWSVQCWLDNNFKTFLLCPKIGFSPIIFLSKIRKVSHPSRVQLKNGSSKRNHRVANPISGFALHLPKPLKLFLTCVVEWVFLTRPREPS